MKEKRIVRIYCAVLLVFLLLLSVCCSGCSVSPEKELEKANRKHSVEILEALGIENVGKCRKGPGDTKDVTVGGRYDFNITSYALLDEQGNLIRINRMTELQELHAEKKKVKDSAFASEEELIEYLETELIGDGYALVSEKSVDTHLLAVRYEKVLSDDQTDRSDFYSITIDRKYMTVYMMSKVGGSGIASSSEDDAQTGNYGDFSEQMTVVLEYHRGKEGEFWYTEEYLLSKEDTQLLLDALKPNEIEFSRGGVLKLEMEKSYSVYLNDSQMIEVYGILNGTNSDGYVHDYSLGGGYVGTSVVKLLEEIVDRSELVKSVVLDLKTGEEVQTFPEVES